MIQRQWRHHGAVLNCLFIVGSKALWPQLRQSGGFAKPAGNAAKCGVFRQITWFPPETGGILQGRRSAFPVNWAAHLDRTSPHACNSALDPAEATVSRGKVELSLCSPPRWGARHLYGTEFRTIFQVSISAQGSIVDSPRWTLATFS